MTSSPFRPNATVEDQLAYYKSQYEQLELELHEFQASSKDLEAELEKDVEESEKRERRLKEQVESLGFEVDEWKTKCKQSRDEANRAQTVLQKEITTMRESNRTLQLKLRDIEVANDDYERQARNTTSSLEDLESKFNVAIERGVILDEEIRQGEKEREQLRIETQRLRDELSDLRVEFDITVEKLHHTEAALERSHSRRLPLHANPARPRSPTSETSAITPPSPSISTPPAGKSEASGSDMPTPPSPPLSDTAAIQRTMQKTPLPSVRRSLLPEGNTTPRPTKLGTRLPRHSRGPSLSGQALSSMSSTAKMGPPRPRPSIAPSESLPRSSSLYQIKGLIGRMQKIEERVHSVRSKLPPSSRTASPRNSPRAMAGGSDAHVPASVTLRSSRKRPSNVGSLTNGADPSPEIAGVSKRLSFGVPPPTTDRPGSSSRPSSRASNVSAGGLEQPNPFVRPSSRLSMGGSRTPLPSRPRSSMGGRGGTTSSISEEATPTNSRRTTLDRTGIPTPGKRRESTGVPAAGPGRRTSQVFRGVEGSMAPPPPRKTGVGETY
ncbi:hypothetical protein K461DRAFT_100753 [Myriangium duriaei CBS 260.36]|uniref:NUDE domain-containing protein n=1 Tax=Myriangium duriaei CBS 260.36 TaxID=1168546 RepID=A0A9P4MLZ9_9PEZI|nr:hypothetical protein K461DRAFT_100753 [Myriangium duriaei CBS 260.36]